MARQYVDYSEIIVSHKVVSARRETAGQRTGYEQRGSADRQRWRAANGL